MRMKILGELIKRTTKTGGVVFDGHIGAVHVTLFRSRVRADGVEMWTLAIAGEPNGTTSLANSAWPAP